MTCTKPAAEPPYEFGQHANRWWDADGPLHTLHAINPARLDYIQTRLALITRANKPLAGTTALDIGCGGGLLAEALAQAGARVTGIDRSAELISKAQAHAQASGLDIEYEQGDCARLPATRQGYYDVVTCLELLEHVADPGAVVAACARLVKPGGSVFFSTLDRTPQSWLLAIVAAERLLRLLPAGTHDYQQFIRPSELSSCCRHCGLEVLDISSLHYLPGLQRAFIGGGSGINYLLHARRPTAA